MFRGRRALASGSSRMYKSYGHRSNKPLSHGKERRNVLTQCITR